MYVLGCKENKITTVERRAEHVLVGIHCYGRGSGALKEGDQKWADESHATFGLASAVYRQPYRRTGAAEEVRWATIQVQASGCLHTSYVMAPA